MAICIINCRTKVTGIQQEKATWCFPWVKIKCLIWHEYFGGRRPDLHVPLQQPNKQTPTTWNIHLNLLKITFLAVYWLSRGFLPTLIINGSGQYFFKIIECFWRVCFPNQYCFLFFFFKLYMCFFCLTCSLIDRCQIGTDTQKMFQSLFGSRFNRLITTQINIIW